MTDYRIGYRTQEGEVKTLTVETEVERDVLVTLGRRAGRVALYVIDGGQQ